MLNIRKAYPIDAYSLINITDIVWKDTFYDILPNGILADNILNKDKRILHLQDQINENNRIFVALDDDTIVGYIFYAKANNEVYEEAAEIRAIYILKEYQRKGIGTNLFNMVLDELKRLGYNSLIVYSLLASPTVDFFLKLKGEKKEIISKELNDIRVNYDLIYFDLDSMDDTLTIEWNTIYDKATSNIHLLNSINKEIAVISTVNGNMYMGLGIKNRVCPIESAIANMHLGEEKDISKILILNKASKPVLPCGRCRDLLIGLGQEKAEILFNYGSLRTMTMQELNPYYKDEEK